VYLGNWNETPVALKRLANDMFEELKHEADILAQLHHPNIVLFLGLYQSDN